MSKKDKRERKEVDRLILAFERIHQEYPKGGYGKYLSKLDYQRAEIANRIGRKK